MELVQDPDIYVKCKKIVKLWECNFMKKNGRLPSKLDIREADKNVRDAYSTYFRLKTAALEQSLLDVLNDDDDDGNKLDNSIENIENVSQSTNDEIDNLQPVDNVQEQINEECENENIWGKHLNNKPVIKAKAMTVKKDDMNASFTKKLFANSKFIKRNPRKSQQFNTTIDTSATELNISTNNLSQTITSIQETEINDITFNSTLPIIFESKNTTVHSVNILDHSQPIRRKIDKGWLQRAGIISQTNDLNDDSLNIISQTILHNDTQSEIDSDDVISDSDDEDTIHQPSKRIKLSTTTNQSFISVTNTSIITKTESKPINNSVPLKPIENFVKIPQVQLTKILDGTNEKNKNETELQRNVFQDEDFDNLEEEIIVNKNRTRKPISETDDNDSDYEEERKPVRRRKATTSAPKNARSKRNSNKPSKTEEEVNKSKETKPASKRKRTTNTAKRETKLAGTSRSTRSKNKKNSIEQSDDKEESNKADAEDYETEYSIKPPPTTVPRYKNLILDAKQQIKKSIKKKRETDKSGNKTEVEIKTFDKTQLAKEKLLKKIKSGTLNDNFVRIDITKKVYVRGKKGINFTKFKKQQWKNKKKALYGPDMDMGGCDGGELICFNCGKTGHFARQCKAKVADQLLPLDAAKEEECLLPSLEEASKMASESVLAVRIPNTISDDKDANNLSDAENNDKTSECEFSSDDDIESFMLNTEIAETNWNALLEENTVKPLYNLNPDGSLIDTPNEVFEALREFGHDSFRAGQEQAVMRILSGQSTLVTLSTGSGKSLCYQLPAYLYAKRRKCVTLVISPLVSLMEDQVSGIGSFLKAACLHTGQTQTQKDKVLKLIESGEIHVLLVSPEAVTAGEKRSGFGSFLRKLPSIAFACIDEAHCVSQWSHNFRPSYLVICRVLRERLGIKTVLGLTATSTYATSTSIVEHLQIPDGRNGVISDIPLPDNLFLNISSDARRDEALKHLLMSDRYKDFDSIIVYCTRREECERIASTLRISIRSNIRKSPVKKYKSLSEIAEPYHAGLPASKRRTVQNAFMNGYLRIVVATVAFGMGINKANIRGVIHYNMPRNFESYVQEVGRAGRDGLPAHCHLFLDYEGKDQNELRRHIYANSMDRHAIRKLIEKLFVPCGCKKICPRHEVAFSIDDTVKLLDVPQENISTLLCYLELHEQRYIELLTPVYTRCKIISYGGVQQIKKAAKECPPLAMAIAMQNVTDEDMKDNVFEFPVVDVAAAIGWDSGIVKSKLKNLEWVTENNMPKRSAITVEFSNLGFHVRSPGNLSPTELDEALDSLYAKKRDTEVTALQQLQAVYTALTAVAERSYHRCLTEDYEKKSKELKTKIREYFSSEEPLQEIEIKVTDIKNEAQIIADVRNLVAMYRDNTFTGRAVARIFHGIQSPNYPAVIWGRCKFWRAHLNSDFNKVCQICTAEILKLK